MSAILEKEPCPKCRSTNVIFDGKSRQKKLGQLQWFRCKACFHRWKTPIDPSFQEGAFIFEANERMIKGVALLAIGMLSFEQVERHTREYFGAGVKAESLKSFLEKAAQVDETWNILTQRVLSLSPKTVTPRQMEKMHRFVQAAIDQNISLRKEGLAKKIGYQRNQCRIQFKIQGIFRSTLVERKVTPTV